MLTTLLDEALDAWTDARYGVIGELSNIPANRFDFRPSPDVRSVTELAQHIMEVSLMMVGELTREDTNFHRKPWPKLLAMYAGDLYRRRTKRDLLAALRKTHADGAAAFRAVGELHMLGLIERFDRQKGTRLAWLHHGIAQEMYHCGQLATYERLMGLTPALTQKIAGGFQ